MCAPALRSSAALAVTPCIASSQDQAHDTGLLEPCLSSVNYVQSTAGGEGKDTVPSSAATGVVLMFL